MAKSKSAFTIGNEETNSGKFWAYVRVSTDEQETQAQRYAILKYCKENRIKLEGAVEEKCSGAVDILRRKLRFLLKTSNSGDTIICTEISRIARTMTLLFEIYSKMLKKNINLLPLKQKFFFSFDLKTKQLFMALLGFVAQIERELLQARTKEGLAARKLSGKKLGRPVGAKGKSSKCERQLERIVKLMDAGASKVQIAKKCGVCYTTIIDFIKTLNMEEARTEAARRKEQRRLERKANKDKIEADKNWWKWEEHEDVEQDEKVEG